MSEADNNSFISSIYWCCTVYVFLKILYKLWTLADQYILPNYREPNNFKSYGQWAVITGSTDGIGERFAKELASKRINICLISRSEQKLQNTAKEIEERYNVRTKCIAADFTDQNVYTHIKDNLEGLDIGILINNVGIATKRNEPFRKHKDETLKNCINVNILSALMMTSIVLPCMIRKKKGLIVNISSIAGELIPPYAAVYSATKACLTKLGACLSYELNKHNIEVKTLTPGYVKTKMIRGSSFAETLSIFAPNVDTYVPSAISSLNSISIKSCGYFPHEVFLMITKLFPPVFTMKYFEYMYKGLN
ncbi:hypothetical protein O3M35_006669 [Rhynocoris fuscipes]|uniref:Steroid dehydrogenase n=1 Tax=Rhynocoris fuscipes TaxID=488301 RepID=A0AAW1DJK9_9HEMI